MKIEYKIGQIVKLKKPSDFSADQATIIDIQHDLTGEYGSYLLENKDPLLFGWFNEAQFEPIDLSLSKE